MNRTKPPQCSMQDFLDTRVERNEKILKSTKASGDAKHDEEACAKTIAETERGVLLGPFGSFQEVPFDDMELVPRHGIWEQHGEAIAPSCRCIDDMLQGCQNETVGTVSSHRPTDPDGLVSQVRAVRRRYPKARLSGWPCDLEKAYKQVPNESILLWLTISVMWAPALQRPEFFLPLCQLFGGNPLR